jgi:hypothetical protein
MAKSQKPKKKTAREMTPDEVMDRVFGKGAHRRIREVLDHEDAEKGKRHPKPKPH